MQVDKPIWDSSDDSNEQLVATDHIALIPKGSIFELNKQDARADFNPIYCTVHLNGSLLKLYLNKPHVDLIRDKLKPVAEDTQDTQTWVLGSQPTLKIDRGDTQDA